MGYALGNYHMIVGPIRLMATDEEGRRSNNPTHWLIMQAYPSPPRVEYMYVFVPIPPSDTDRVLLSCDFENAFHTLEYLVSHREIL